MSVVVFFVVVAAEVPFLRSCGSVVAAVTAVVRSDLLPATDSAAADHARNLDWVVGIETVVAHEVDLLIAALVAADVDVLPVVFLLFSGVNETGSKLMWSILVSATAVHAVNLVNKTLTC